MATVYKKGDNDTVEAMIKRLRKKVQDDNIIQELKKREYYMSKSLKRKIKSEKARARERKRMNVIQLNTDRD